MESGAGEVPTDPSRSPLLLPLPVGEERQSRGSTTQQISHNLHADGLEQTELEEERVNTFMFAQTIEELGHINLDRLRTQLRHRHSSFDAVLPWSEDPRELSPRHSPWTLSGVPTTPSLRAKSLETARTDTPGPENLQNLIDDPVMTRDHTAQMRPTMPRDSFSEVATLAHIGSDFIIPAWNHEMSDLAFTGIGQQDHTVQSVIGSVEGSNQSSLVTFGTCPGMKHPSTIPGGFGSQHPPLNIFVQIPGQDEDEGFRAMQDSACNVNVMKEEIWRRLGQPQLHASNCETIHGLAGEAYVLGCFKLCFQIDGYANEPFKTVFQVVPDRCLGVDALLCGMFIERLPARV